MMSFSHLEPFKGISKKRLIEILDKIQEVKIGFVGDISIDMYWIADMKKSELSRETPHFPLPIVEENLQLGSGGNVMANLAALKPRKIVSTSVIGDDWRGDLVKRCMKELAIPMDHILTISGLTTNAYCKPIKTGISNVVYEDPRIDFTGAPISEKTEKQLISNLEKMAGEVDAICVTDQFENGCITEKIRNVLFDISDSKLNIVVDSRDRAGKFKNVILKPNEIECFRAASELSGIDAKEFVEKDMDGILLAANIIKEKLNCDLSLTLGSKGNIQFYDQNSIHISPRDIKGPLDFCGAGDSFLSAYVSALASGASREEAGQIGSLASEVVISKVGQTGVPAISEIISRYENAYM